MQLDENENAITMIAVTLSIHSSLADHALGKLPREDLDLITQLVLRSGSLKDLATAYGVSYPTIRARLDRVIERLQQAVEGKRPDKLRDFLAGLVERGEISVGSAQAIKEIVRELAPGGPPDGGGSEGAGNHTTGA